MREALIFLAIFTAGLSWLFALWLLLGIKRNTERTADDTNEIKNQKGKA